MLGQQRERRGALVALRADAAAEVVDRVVAAPEDPVVVGLAVVVELVGEVGEALAPAPADRVALRRRQRLGDEHVVVDRHDVAADRAHERREGARGQQRAAGEHAAAGRVRAHAGAVARQRRGRRALVDLRAGRLRRAGEAPAQPGRDRRARSRRAATPADVGRRVDLRAHRGRVEQLGVPAVAARELDALLQPRQLVLRRSATSIVARVLPAAVDPVALDRRAHRVEVLAAHPLERVELARPARAPVLDPVGERGRAEAAVAARRAEGELLALEQRRRACRPPPPAARPTGP